MHFILLCCIYMCKILIEKNDSVFIVIVVVLVVVIIISCSAVIYLLRQDRRLGGEEARRRRRYNAQPLIDRDLSTNPGHSRKWYSYLWGSRDRHYHSQLDKSATMMGPSEEGRIQANDREWDVDDFSEDRALRSVEGNQSAGLLRMSEHESSASSFVGPRAYTHRMHSHGSSVLRYDPHDVQGLAYPDQFPISPQATIPSVQSSQLYSPTLSSPHSSPVPRQITNSPERISNNPPSQDSDHDSDRDSQSQFAAPPVTIRTAGSGTKFFESL